MQAGLHEISVHLLLWGGALLFAWALLADWIRQRKPSRWKLRCPKCWQDTSHTTASELRCSERGYNTRPIRIAETASAAAGDE
jgi:hypothetical protein